MQKKISRLGRSAKAELQSLIRAKKLNARSLVWQPGMQNWQELGLFIRRRHKGKGGQAASPAVPVKQALCSECGLGFAEDEYDSFSGILGMRGLQAVVCSKD